MTDKVKVPVVEIVSGSLDLASYDPAKAIKIEGLVKLAAGQLLNRSPGMTEAEALLSAALGLRENQLRLTM